MNPTDYPQIFGRDFAKRNSDTIVSIGNNHYTKYDLGQLGCPHPNAARRLNTALKSLKVAHFDDLMRHYSPEDFAGIKGFGVTSFYALICLIRGARLPVRQFYKSKVTVNTLTDNVRKNGRKRR